MISRASLALLLVLAGAMGLNTSLAAAADAAAAKAQQAKALKAKKAKQQQAARAKALQQQKAAEKKDEWYAKDRDRGLDIAAKYAPKTIAKVRKNDYIAKGDTVSTGGGGKGWRRYMDKYYSP